MGERKKRALRVGFDRSVKLEFHGAKISSDAGLMLHRELDGVLGLTKKAETVLEDMRTGKNTQHTLTALLRQSVYGRLAGYEDVNDAERLRLDPTMRQVVGGRAKRNLAASGDSSESPTHGRQEGSAYNGHFGKTCYHPLFCFNQFGDLERAMLREGHVHSAENWQAVLEPVVERYREHPLERFFRGDAAFANPDIYEYLEGENYWYAIRLPSNQVLCRTIEHMMTRPIGRPSQKPKVFYHSFDYQAQSWNQPRRVVAKIEWHAGELFPRIGFIVTNLPWSSKRVVQFYNQRGTAEQWIKEGKIALTWTRLSCHEFRDNEVRLQLFALAYNLGNFLRRLALPRKIKHWSLTTLREKAIKIGAKVVHSSRYVTFQLAEVAIKRELFDAILKRIDRLRLAPQVT
jgi:hypothetical protein